jgi:hypothetical protein
MHGKPLPALLVQAACHPECSKPNGVVSNPRPEPLSKDFHFVYSKCHIFKRVVVFTLFVATPASLAGSDLPSSNNIPRFQMLTTGRIEAANQTKKVFEFLKQQGVKTIINLRMENDEETTVKQLGMNCVEIAIDDPRPTSRTPSRRSRNISKLSTTRKTIRFSSTAAAARTARRHGRDVSDCESRMGCGKTYGEAQNIGLRWW